MHVTGSYMKGIVLRIYLLRITPVPLQNVYISIPCHYYIMSHSHPIVKFPTQIRRPMVAYGSSGMIGRE